MKEMLAESHYMYCNLCPLTLLFVCLQLVKFHYSLISYQKFIKKDKIKGGYFNRHKLLIIKYS